MDSDKDLFREIYKLTVEQEHYFLDAHHTRLSTYLGILAALFGATVTGAIKASTSYATLLLCIGPVLIILVAQVGKYSCSRMYQRFLETIATRAKLEAELGLNRSRREKGNWTTSFSIVASRHRDMREKFYSDTEFVESQKRSGEQRAAGLLFSSIQALTTCLLIALISRAAQY